MIDAHRFPLSVASTVAAAAVSVGCRVESTSIAERAPVARSAGAAEDFRAAAARNGAGATDPEHAGIWKAATPAEESTRGEFANSDPVGLSVGVRIKADCSINWVDPDSGKRYCFSTATSLVFFLDAPRAYLVRATASWDSMEGAATH
jgi:hypothetical protein